MTPKFNKTADKFLADFYDSIGSTTPDQKYKALELKLGCEGGCFSHEIPIESKVTMLEMELLERNELIDYTLC